MVLHVDMEDPALWLAEELTRAFRGAGFVGVLVNLWEVKPVSLAGIAAAIKFKHPDSVAWKPPDPNKKPEQLHHELVVWRSSEYCQESLAVQAVSSMWGLQGAPL